MGRLDLLDFHLVTTHQREVDLQLDTHLSIQLTTNLHTEVGEEAEMVTQTIMEMVTQTIVVTQTTRTEDTTILTRAGLITSIDQWLKTNIKWRH